MNAADISAAFTVSVMTFTVHTLFIMRPGHNLTIHVNRYLHQHVLRYFVPQPPFSSIHIPAMAVLSLLRKVSLRIGRDTGITRIMYAIC